ncbi:uncharacterized protein LOC124194162 [Daphnia pulex]|uniref:uncharacterized protein LOC124194162 n=1 Tax=Daphnia pulex TaxID=6669 RepID=UPI001EE12D57|nr:uncharacterized protein LOC124194162 [Daphnia pulex]
MVSQTLLFGALLLSFLVADRLEVVQARPPINFAEEGRKIDKYHVLGLRGNFHRRIIYINNILSDKDLPRKTTKLAGKLVKNSVQLVLLSYLDYFTGGITPTLRKTVTAKHG